MNNVFNPKRFGKYFLYDLKCGYNNFGINLLTLGMLPFLVYIVCAVLNLIFTGTFKCNLGDTQIILTLVCYFVVMIAYPVKVYGRYTSRQTGANWITLPASSLEKFLSMLLVLAIVLPVAFSLLMYLSNGILALIYENPSKNLLPILRDRSIYINGMTSDGIAYYWITYTVLFALGSLIFKKAKVVKTFLSYFLIVFLLLFIVQEVFFDGAGRPVFSDPGPHAINLFLNLFFIVQILILCGGLYWRIRKIKY